MNTEYKPFTINKRSECGRFEIVRPYIAARLPHLAGKAKWKLFGRRAGVSAEVLEPLTAIQFPTRAHAYGYLSHCNNLD